MVAESAASTTYKRAGGSATAGPSTHTSPAPKLRLKLAPTSTKANGKLPERQRAYSDSSALTSDYDEDDEPVVSHSAAMSKGAKSIQRSPENVKKPTPVSREKKRKGRKEAVERSRARADKRTGGADGDVDMEDGQQTPKPHQAFKQRQEDHATNGGKSPKTKRQSANGRMHPHEAASEDDEESAGLPSAFNGQEIEDLDYGQGHIDEDELERAVEGRDWWEDEEEDEEEEENLFITNLSDSEIAQLASQSSASESGDDSLSDTDSDDSSDDVDAFGFPMLDSNLPPALDASGQPLILMEDWDGNFVLVQPKPEDVERSRSRSRGERRSRTGGSTTAGEQTQLIVDSEAMDTDSSDDDCDYGDDEDGGDTTDSMAEEDMPSLPSVSPERFLAAIPTGQETALAQDLGVSLEEAAELLAKGREQEMLAMASAAAAAVAENEAAMMDVDVSSVPSGTPAEGSAPLLTPALSTSASESSAAPVVPFMGSFRPLVNDPGSHAVIDGSSKDTPSPFTRRRARPRGNSTSTAASASSKPRKERVAPYSPYGTPGKTRYSSIPGHPRYIAAVAAAQRLQMQHVCGDREDTPSEPESDPEPMSLEDMLDASMLVHQSFDAVGDVPGGEEHLRHLIRFDRVPVSTYRQRNYNFAGNASRDRTRPIANGALSPQSSVPNHLFSPTASRRASTLTETLAGPAGVGGRLMVSPLLNPVDHEHSSLSRKSRRKERRGRRQDQPHALPPLQI